MKASMLMLLATAFNVHATDHQSIESLQSSKHTTLPCTGQSLPSKATLKINTLSGPSVCEPEFKAELGDIVTVSFDSILFDSCEVWDSTGSTKGEEGGVLEFKVRSPRRNKPSAAVARKAANFSVLLNTLTDPLPPSSLFLPPPLDR
jgi:hypothetical protein